jgi:class 3 adenylate cyclase
VDKTHAVILFVDIRHFSRWTNLVDTSLILEEFLTIYYEILIKHFPNTFIKRLGDGAMIINSCPSPQHASALEDLLAQILTQIAGVEQRFANLCVQVHTRYGHEAPLLLGWGVSRGMIQCVFGASDFIGTNINEASRLCGLARPHGVVLDAEDFPRLPPLQGTPWQFRAVQHQLKGYDRHHPLWVSTAVEL